MAFRHRHCETDLTDQANGSQSYLARATAVHQQCSPLFCVSIAFIHCMHVPVLHRPCPVTNLIPCQETSASRSWQVHVVSLCGCCGTDMSYQDHPLPYTQTVPVYAVWLMFPLCVSRKVYSFMSRVTLSHLSSLRLLLLLPELSNNLASQSLEKSSRLDEWQHDRDGCACENPQKPNDDPASEEAFAENVVREEHGHRNLQRYLSVIDSHTAAVDLPQSP